MIDHAVSMAVAVQSHKGIYALLLGSGISRAAGIPTGWEIISDLIKRVAAAQEEDVGDDPEAWFRSKFDREPSYSELLELLAPNPAERTMLLRDYFEPNDEEREEGLKLPTNGHKAIARLVAAGNIRVIITTNFDRLLERAIEAEGVSPTVVSTVDQVEGMVPLPHVRCLVLKVHGDYLDMRLRNTPDELAKYPDAINDLLNRIFTDYGLIICGWSGDWDVALTDAITRNTRFRFSTYWLAHGKLSSKASDLRTRRQAIVVSIEDADKAFTLLAGRIEAIEQERLIDPTSPRIAVARAKRLLSSDQHRIAFYDLVMRELKEVRRKTNLEVMPLSTTPGPDKQSYPQRVEQMAAACSVLVPVIATGVMWDNGTCDDIGRRCITFLARSEFRSGSLYHAWSQLQYLPASFIAYSACAAALVTRRLDVFRVVFLEAQAMEADREPMPAIEKIGIVSVFLHDTAQFLHGPESRCQTPGADWMVKKLESMLIDVLPPDVQFEELWDEIELITSLISFDITGQIMPGRFMWRCEGRRSSDSLIQKVRSELDQLSESENNHPLLTAGLFMGDAARLRAALDSVQKVADKMSF